MRRKIANTIDASLYEDVKRLAVRENKPINQIIEESLRDYIQRNRYGRSVVQETRGMYNVAPELVRRVMNEDMYDS